MKAPKVEPRMTLANFLGDQKSYDLWVGSNWRVRKTGKQDVYLCTRLEAPYGSTYMSKETAIEYWGANIVGSVAFIGEEPM